MAAVNGASTVSGTAPPSASAAPFSYAQAAKGKSPAVKATEAKTEAGHESPSLKAITEGSTNWADDSNTVVEAQDSTSVNISSPTHDVEDSQTFHDETKTADTSNSGNTLTESRSSSQRKHDDRSPSASAPTELAWRRRPQQDAETSSGSASDAGDQKDDRKEKSKDRSQYVEAPAPVVNIWAQRASDAKVKPTPPASSAPVAEKMKSTRQDTAPAKASGGPKASTESTKERKSDNARAARSSEPSATRVRVPSMDDAGLWPTPETSKDDERRKSQPSGKTDTLQSSTDSTKPHGKSDWKKIEFTPSVKFETPVPPLGSRGRGRGGSRGGSRESGGRGGFTGAAGRGSTAEEQPSTGTTKADQIGGKSAQSGPRPRKSADESSKPAAARNAKEENESTSAPPPDSGRVSPKSSAAPGDAAAPAVDGPSRRKVFKAIEADAAPFKPAEATPVERKRGNSLNGFVPKTSGSERRSENSGKSSDNGPPFTREGRPERGGRGGKRGGFFNGGGSHANSGYAPNGGPATGYYSPKNGSFTNGFQGANAFSPSRNGRSNGQRNSSFPTENPPYSPTMNGYPVTPGMGSPGLPGYYGFPGLNPMGPQGYEYHHHQHIAMLNGISNQLNYYFSFDNLIKDMFLRAHMTSSGYVPLSFIADFQRMKFLSQDLGMIRMVAMQSPDFVVRTDVEGQTHIRKRHDWEQFVLDMDARKPSARNDGPSFPDELPQAPIQEHQGPRNPADAMFQPMQPPHLFNQFSPATAGSPVNGYPRSPSGRYSMSAIDGHFDFNQHSQQPTLFLSDQAREASAPQGEADDFEDEKLDQLQVVVRPRGAASELSRVTSDGPSGNEHLGAPGNDNKAEDVPNGTHKRYE